jgi:hypothetical protein
MVRNILCYSWNLKNLYRAQRSSSAVFMQRLINSVHFRTLCVIKLLETKLIFNTKKKLISYLTENKLLLLCKTNGLLVFRKQ